MRKALKEARQRAGLTQSELAAKLGIGRRQYIAIEQGQSGGSLGVWIRIKAALDLSSDEIMDCMLTESMRAQGTRR